MLTVKLLNSAELIEEASALLYSLHIKELQWKFSVNNPSHLRIEMKNGRNLLLDRFTEQAVWFGAFDDKQLIGCMRLTHPDNSGKFELESYPTSEVVHEYLPHKDVGVELSKIAVEGKYAGQGVVKRMWLAAFKYCQAKRYSVICCTHNGYLKNMFARIGFPLKLEHAFKYEPADPLPVNFYLAHHSEELNRMIHTLECLDGDLSLNSSKIFKALEIVAPILPVSTYWHDVNGVVLGVNEHCLTRIGSSYRDIVGKSPYEFYPEHTAEHIVSHNNQVIRSGEVMTQEEWIEDITTGDPKCFSSTKAPLYDDEGNIIGVIGSFVEVTGEKEKERLILESQTQQIAEQEKFKQIVRQMGHDITAPISSINNILRRLGNIIPENERVTLRAAAERIEDISQKLLSRYDTQVDVGDEVFLLSLALMQIVRERREDHRDTGIIIEADIAEGAHFACIKHNSGVIKRMLTNLIKNAVEATLGNSNGRVTISLGVFAHKVVIIVEDNGCGMPQHIQDKFKAGISVTEGKDDGHGVGLTQVRDAIYAGDGTCEINANVNGTTIRIGFPEVATPSWITTNIKLTKDDTILILDDDESIHGSWNSSFKDILEKNPTLKVMHFFKGKDVINYVNNLNTLQKQDIFLLTDFELEGQGINGMDVVAQTNIKRAILVTSYSTYANVQTAVNKANITMLPKELAYAAKILVDKKIAQWKNKADMVWVEDQKWLVDDLVKTYCSHLKVDIYCDPVSFMDNINQYPLDTRIILDTYYESPEGEPYWETGYDLAATLHAMGYTKLILYAGEPPHRIVPAYLTIILKTDIDAIVRILK